MATVNGDGQLGMDERVVDDVALSDLLEKRLRLADDKSEITATTSSPIRTPRRLSTSWASRTVRQSASAGSASRGRP